MGRLAIIRRLWRNRELLGRFLDLVQQAARTARTLADIRKAVTEGIEAGQLDEPLDRFAAANDRAKNYIKTGR